MVNAVTPMEQLVCQALVADGMYCADQGLDDTHVYMAPIANALLRGDLGDSAMDSLGRELVQQFLRDIRNAVAEEEKAADALAAFDEATSPYPRADDYRFDDRRDQDMGFAA